MESLLPSISLWVLIGLVLCLVGLVTMACMALFTFLFKVGVAINEARKPPHLDAGDYRLDQGREVRPELHNRGGAEYVEGRSQSR